MSKFCGTPVNRNFSGSSFCISIGNVHKNIVGAEFNGGVVKARTVVLVDGEISLDLVAFKRGAVIGSVRLNAV